jgi:hypothetical protein
MKFIIILLVLGIAQICQGQSKGGHWEFENNGFDTADWDSMDDPGSLVNTASYGDSLPLQQGAYYLRLSNTQAGDYFKVEDSNDLDFNNENIGISAWIYPFVLNNDVYFLINKGQQDTNPKTTNYALRISTTMHLEFLIRDANNQAQTAASSFLIPVNQWTFVAAFYDYTAAKVYFWNTPTAEAVDTVAFNQNLIPNNHPLAIGGWYSATTALSKPFKGRIDDVRISGRMEDIIPGLTAVQEKIMTDEVSDMNNQVSVYPNPVHLNQGGKRVTIRVHSPQSQEVTVTIFNILGQKLFQSLIFIEAKNYQYSMDLSAVLGEQLGTGLYFINVNGKQFRQIKKLLIIR